MTDPVCGLNVDGSEAGYAGKDVWLLQGRDFSRPRQRGRALFHFLLYFVRGIRPLQISA